MSQGPLADAKGFGENITHGRGLAGIESAAVSCAMHFLYVDESGDPGSSPGASTHFILCGLLVHHADWHIAQRRLMEMRQRLSLTHGLPVMAELHASEFLGDSRDHLGLTQRSRLQCLLHALGCVRRLEFLMPICVVVEKGAADPMTPAWAEMTRLAQAWVGQVATHPACGSSGLVIVCDDFRPSPGRRWVKSIIQAQPSLSELLVDLPFGRESQDSHLLQLCDLLSFVTKQTLTPNRFFGTRGGKQLLKRFHSLWACRGLKVQIKG